MSPRLNLERKLLVAYCELFVNRRAHTVQTVTREGLEEKCYYYRPKDDRCLSLEKIGRHFLGELTIGLYAINPATQCCKWIAIDADYQDAVTDLLRLQWELRNDGIDSALERSRRGGHLWMFAQEPLLAADCRRYVLNLAARVRAGKQENGQPQIVGSASIEGIEIFPKQDRLSPGEFGNAIRGPLGIHRRDGKRYWFYGADYDIKAQLEYLQGLGKLSQKTMTRLLAGIPPTADEPCCATERGRNHGSFIGRRSSWEEFSILRYLGGRVRRMGRNYFTRCPACARRGHDKHGDNLAISVTEPNKYRCWAGCTKEEIRAALGLRVSGTYYGR
jgi:TOTE conflict system primase-like protein